jgi:hypothetical protein
MCSSQPNFQFHLPPSTTDAQSPGERSQQQMQQPLIGITSSSAAAGDSAEGSF